MKSFSTEIIHLELSVANHVQDVVVEVEFNYTHTPPVKGGEVTTLHIALTHFWLTFKKDITDEKPTLVELPVEFFSAAILEYFNDCIIENFDALVKNSEDYKEKDNS